MGAGGVAGFSGRLWFLAPSDREHASVRFPVSTAPWPPGTLVSTRAYPRPRCTRDRHPGLGSSRSSPPSQLEFSVVLRRHVRERADSGRTMKRSSQTCPPFWGGFWGPASWVEIPFEIVDCWGGFGAQLAGSESRSKSSMLGGLRAQLAGSESLSKS